MHDTLTIELHELDHPVQMISAAADELERGLAVLEQEVRAHQSRLLNAELRRDSARRRLENTRAWLAERGA